MIVTPSDPFIAHIVEHASYIFGGATALGLVAHAVNTFPTPTSRYGAWFLGVIQFAVGQRVSAKNTLAGADTVAMAVPKGTGTGTGG